MSASRSSRRSARLAACSLFVGVAALTAVSACSAGQVAQTSRQVAAVPGANVDASGAPGWASLRDMVILYNGPSGYPQGGSAPLVIRVFNNGTTPLTLTKVTAGDAATSVLLVGGAGATPTVTPEPTISTTQATPTGGPSGSANPSGAPGVSLGLSPSSSRNATPTPTKPAGQADFRIDIPPASFVQLVPGSGPFLQLTGLSAALTPGQSVPLTFTFDGGLTAKAQVPFGVPQTQQPRVTGGVDVNEAPNEGPTE